jgi:hypothetical protein
MARFGVVQKDFQRYLRPLVDVDRPVATVWYGEKEGLKDLVM